MKKIILTTMAICAFGICFSNESKAQSSAKTPGNKKPQVENTADSKATHSNNTTVHARGTSTGSSAKQCTPLNRNNPFAISRKDFQKLPADRQRFILENQSKYTIID
ncbi:MAG: hypothetical protein ACO3O0_06455 [Bacteroidia bacterium]